jgi:hypothetical protein
MSEKIDIKNAKCSHLSFESIVNFKKMVDKPDGKSELSGFEIEAYTGAVVDRWWGKLAINVAGISAKQQMPVFKNHDPDKIVGYSTSTAKDASFWVNGVFSDATESAKEIKGLAAEGFPWQASIGVRPKVIMEIREGASMNINGAEVLGPAEVWMESEVVETSFVPLGADANTRISVFSEIQETDKNRAILPKNNNAERPIMDLKTLKKDHADLVTAIIEEALAGWEVKLADAIAEGFAKGAIAEQLRIKGVREQSVPGHEALIEQMAFDGKSTAADAALAIVAAEKTLRATTLANIQNNAAPIIPQVDGDNLAAVSGEVKGTVEEMAKAAWDKSEDVRDEFRSFGAFLAFRKAEAAGQVRIFGQK